MQQLPCHGGVGFELMTCAINLKVTMKRKRRETTRRTRWIQTWLTRWTASQNIPSELNGIGCLMERMLLMTMILTAVPAKPTQKSWTYVKIWMRRMLNWREPGALLLSHSMGGRTA